MFDVVDSALSSMVRGPTPFARALEFAAENLDDASVTPDALLDYLRNTGPGDDTLGLLRRKLAAWDNEEAQWAAETARNTAERRSLIYDRLGFDEKWRALCEERLPFQSIERPTVIAVEHERWYTPEVHRGRDYYWSHYVEQLKKNDWSDESILQLDESTRSIVERLADPTSETAYQSKGLVVGYVQSGKTANFTGVVAKAADAGYRLIIVLGGMLDVLRNQTQRRIDKELVGKELLQREYANDPDWDEFLSHGAKPSEMGAFDLSRLTGPEGDYQSVKYALDALRFERHDKSQAFNSPDNLYRADARIAVLKKNSAVIGRLLTDLRKIARSKLGAPLDQIPVLIIDDESDQGGINTRAPSPSGADDRAPTNRAIVELLKILPRAQYVGYTATPFANVFVDPSSEEDIFPKDFLISLPRPTGYMGVSDFYDLDAGDGDPTPNRRDFVRDVVDRDEKPANLQRAIDCFILAGAIKLWRAARDEKLKFRHHTMLVHVSQKQADHRTLAELVRKTYRTAGYDGGKGLDRLEKLLETDFRPVHERRGGDLEFPASFDELVEHVGECLQKIGEPAEAVLIINTQNKQDTPDFQQRPVWKILVGGTKLSRGYTVEGLTVSYYRRRTGAADTLMQMGRWFGFRRGFSDLVRLFIGTQERVGRSGTLNLYEAFGAVCRDEETFRKELERYASMDDPRITPAQIPPLVPQHMLRPTAPNKMRNARLVSRNFGGQLAESTYAPTDKGLITKNNALLAELVGNQAAEERHLEAEINGSMRTLAALTAGFSTDQLIRFLQAYHWYNPKSREATQGNPLRLQLEFLEGKHGAHEIADWLMVAPRISNPRAKLKLAGAEFDVVHRSRHADQQYRFNTYNDPIHRQYAQHISGQKLLPHAGKELEELRTPHRGVMLYYPITEQKTGSAPPPFTVGFTLLFPPNHIRSQLSFSVIKKGLAEDAVVTV